MVSVCYLGNFFVCISPRSESLSTPIPQGVLDACSDVLGPKNEIIMFDLTKYLEKPKILQIRVCLISLFLTFSSDYTFLNFSSLRAMNYIILVVNI